MACADAAGEAIVGFLNNPTAYDPERLEVEAFPGGRREGQVAEGGREARGVGRRPGLVGEVRAFAVGRPAGAGNRPCAAGRYPRAEVHGLVC